MAQLHLYISDDEARSVRQRAEADGLSISKWLAALVKREVRGRSWPEGWFESVVGGWAGQALERPDQGDWPDDSEREPFAG
jgi:hypothetical protein